MNDYAGQPTQSGSRETIYTMAKNLEERQVKMGNKYPQKFTKEEKDIFDAYLDRVCNVNATIFKSNSQQK